MTALELFHPGLNDYPGVVLFQDRMTSLESLYLRIEGLPWSRSILGLNDSPGVVQSQDGMTLLESFCPRIELLFWSPSVLG